MKQTSSGLREPREGEEAMHVMSPFEDNSGLSFLTTRTLFKLNVWSRIKQGVLELWATLGKLRKWHYMNS